MLNFVQVQERRKSQPLEYIEYFEDLNLSLTPKLVKGGCFVKVSKKGGTDMEALHFFVCGIAMIFVLLLLVIGIGVASKKKPPDGEYEQQANP